MVSRVSAEASPLQRYYHGGIYADRCLYIIGGQSDAAGTPVDISLRLLLSSEFDSKDAVWSSTGLTGSAAPSVSGLAVSNTLHYESTQVVAVGSDANHDSSNTSRSYLYISRNQSWRMLNTIALSPQAQGDSNHDAIVPEFGVTTQYVPVSFGASLVYSPGAEALVQFGGRIAGGTDQGKATAATQILTPIGNYRLTFQLTGDANEPTPRYLHSALMMNTTHMLVVGGMPDAGSIPSATSSPSNSVASGNLTTNGWPTVDTVHVLDTVHGTWSAVETTGSTEFQTLTGSPGVMYGNAIYFYGGQIRGNTAINHQFLILDVSTTPWSWSNRTLAGFPTYGRYGHSATLVGRYLLLAFGASVDQPIGPDQLYKTLLMVDLSTWTKITTFDLRLATTIPKAEVASGRAWALEADGQLRNGDGQNAGGMLSLSTGSIVGVVFGALVGMALVVYLFMRAIRRQAGGLSSRRRRRRRRHYQDSQGTIDGGSEGSSSSNGPSRNYSHRSLMLFLDQIAPIIVAAPEKSHLSTTFQGSPSPSSSAFAISPQFRSRFPRSPIRPLRHNRLQPLDEYNDLKEPERRLINTLMDFPSAPPTSRQCVP
ncbi:hypothetical protein IWQ60_006220 [Tieghemiomyces parasiticus]|uniref:Galactose oxidase n=1 Tax=Tieghemiomyces parasiticus TaxID=78921 RepID=A0A9W8DSD6_9FUNG|nr:hypothetical protein IWQ60_006220 [Tieghemiomyces parasiticus]